MLFLNYFYLTILFLKVYIVFMTPLEIRFELGLTQEEIARRVGSTQPTISNIESGAKNAGKNLLKRYRKAFPELDIKTSEFLGI